MTNRKRVRNKLQTAPMLTSLKIGIYLMFAQTLLMFCSVKLGEVEIKLKRRAAHKYFGILFFGVELSFDILKHVVCSFNACRICFNYKFLKIEMRVTVKSYRFK